MAEHIAGEVEHRSLVCVELCRVDRFDDDSFVPLGGEPLQRRDGVVAGGAQAGGEGVGDDEDVLAVDLGAADQLRVRPALRGGDEHRVRVGDGELAHDPFGDVVPLHLVTGGALGEAGHVVDQSGQHGRLSRRPAGSL